MFREKLKLQDRINEIATEQGVQSHMRAEFNAGKYQGKVSQKTWDAWERFNSDRTQPAMDQVRSIKNDIRFFENHPEIADPMNTSLDYIKIDLPIPD